MRHVGTVRKYVTRSSHQVSPPCTPNPSFSRTNSVQSRAHKTSFCPRLLPATQWPERQSTRHIGRYPLALLLCRVLPADNNGRAADGTCCLPTTSRRAPPEFHFDAVEPHTQGRTYATIALLNANYSLYFSAAEFHRQPPTYEQEPAPAAHRHLHSYFRCLDAYLVAARHTHGRITPPFTFQRSI